MAAQTREFPITFTMTNMESIVVTATPAGSETVFVVMSSSQSLMQLIPGEMYLST